jgi:hypothetical protein
MRRIEKLVKKKSTSREKNFPDARCFQIYGGEGALECGSSGYRLQLCQYRQGARAGRNEGGSCCYRTHYEGVPLLG